MVMSLAFELPGEPRGKGRPRFSSRGGFVKTYTDAKTRDYETRIREAAAKAMAAAGLEPTDRPVSVRIVMASCPPISWSKKRRLAALLGQELPKKPDLDNVAKCVLDALNNVVYQDDVQVWRLVVTKLYAGAASLSVEILERGE